jgi:hypothetical protein
MPTQNPHAWVGLGMGMGMGTQCRALLGVKGPKGHFTHEQSPALGAHAHAHAHPYPWVLGGHGCDVIIHGWALEGISFVHPCIQLQNGVKLLGCKEYANQ